MNDQSVKNVILISFDDRERLREAFHEVEWTVMVNDGFEVELTAEGLRIKNKDVDKLRSFPLFDGTEKITFET